jgi:hypothetical protein
LFTPPVTTQFISNVERGVTPLPPAHIATLAKALQVTENEIRGLLEKEYSAKLTERLGTADADSAAGVPDPAALESVGNPSFLPGLTIQVGDLAFMQSLYEAYQQADPKTRQTFATVCETILNVRKSAS